MVRKFIFITFSILLTTSDAWDQVPPHIWSHRFGDSKIQNAQCVAKDGSNNVAITGYFASSVDFGGDTLTSAGGWDIYMAKFDSAGNHLWSQRFGDSDDQRAYGIVTDVSGNVIVTGRLAGTVDFGGDTLTSAGFVDVFLAKFDSNGNHLWSQRFGDSSSQIAHSVAVDGSSNVIVTGNFGGSVDFGGDTLTSAGDSDIFLVKIDPNGNHLWSQRFGDSGRQFAHSIATDGLGNVIIAGYFGGTVDFGGDTLTCAGNYDIYMAKFDPNGNHLWSKRFGDSNLHFAYGVTADGLANVILTGEFWGTVDFGGGPLTSAGATDIYVAKFDANGNHVWSKRFGDSDLQQGRTIAVDGSDNIIIAASFYGTVNFGGGWLTSTGISDIYVAKFDANGDYVWSMRYGDPGTQQCTSVAVDGSDNVILTGYFDGNVSFGGGTLTSAGIYDIFLVKLGPTGVTAVAERPIAYQLGIRTYPNPFNPTTTITYFIPKGGMVSLRVYDSKGRLLKILVNESRTEGEHSVTWKGQNAGGNMIASGVYFVRLEAGGQVKTRKIVLLK